MTTLAKKSGLNGISILFFILSLALSHSCANKPQVNDEDSYQEEYIDEFDYYDYYQAGYDVTEERKDEDWFFDYYDSSQNPKNMDYEYDWVEEEYEWEEEGLFNLEDR